MNLHRIGVVGCGPTCRPLIARLIELGVAVTVSDPDPEQLAVAVGLGACPAALPADVAEDVDLVVVGVADTRAAEEVLFDLGGIGETLRTGGWVLNLSPVDPEFRARAESHLSSFGIRYVGLDAVSVGALAASPGGDRTTVLAGAAC